MAGAVTARNRRCRMAMRVLGRSRRIASRMDGDALPSQVRARTPVARDRSRARPAIQPF
jgi:hypothetical protein